jgi:hypothetical protein
MIEILAWSIAPILVEAAKQAISDYILKRPSKADSSQPDGDEKLEISPVFGSFVTRNGGFASELIDLRDLVQAYANRQSVKRPLNILLAAEPGSGKSFLIKQLARSIDGGAEIEFDEFHVAAFRSIDDLLGVFQRVQSANLGGKLPFVLFDEVDGRVEGRNVLSNFLAPMWDGAFHSGKESFSLGRAVFFFAASSMVPPPSIDDVLGKDHSLEHGLVSYDQFADKWANLARKAVEGDGTQRIEKCKDFMDRVDKLVCIPPVHEYLTGNDATQEKLELACLLIQKHFPSVQRIEKAAVVALASKLSETPSRRPTEKAIFCSLVQPAAKSFSFENLPRLEQGRYKDNSTVKQLRGQYYRVSIKRRAN